MARSVIFWTLMLGWLVFGILHVFDDVTVTFKTVGPALIPWFAMAFMGWKVFGDVIKKD
jgi:hypothetical protein